VRPVVLQEVGNSMRGGQKTSKNSPQKSGLGGRQVGAFSVFGARHTGIPFIFSLKTLFFRKMSRFRGWCNTTPRIWGIPEVWVAWSSLRYCLVPWMGLK